MKNLAIKLICLTFFGLSLNGCKSMVSSSDGFLTKDEIMTKIYVQQISLRNNPSFVGAYNQVAGGNYYTMKSDPIVTEIELLSYGRDGTVSGKTKGYYFQFYYTFSGAKKLLGYAVCTEAEYERYNKIMNLKSGDDFHGMMDIRPLEAETRFSWIMQVGAQ